MADTLNEQNSVTLTFSAGNDSVDNRGDSVTVDGAGGKDILINGRYWESERGGSNVSIVGGNGNDTIISHGLKSFLDGGADDDQIYNGYRYYELWNAFYDPANENYNGSNSTISGGTGNDSIKNIGQKVSINGGEGNDSVENNGDLVTIEAGTGNDSIYNYGSTVTIDGGSGNDDIRSFVSNVSINGGDGNNLIISFHKYKYVDGDIVTERAQNIAIKTGADKDTIENYGDSVTIESGAGNDSIDNRGSSVTIDASAGDDYIYNSGANVTINAQDGNDSIKNGGNNVTINTGDGNDSIYNSYYASLTAINAGTDDDYIFNEGDSVTIDAGAGDNTIYNGDNTKDQFMEGGSLVTVKGGSGNDYIYSNVDSVTIDGGDGNNYIKNDFTWEIIGGKAFYTATKNVAIKTGSGDDTIYNSGDSMTIDVGDGNDSVQNWGSLVTINAGTGNNTIRSGGDNALVLLNGGKNIVEGDVTIRLGKGNGTLTGDNDVQIYQYAAGDGDYVITNYSGEDMIHITSGKVDSYSFDGGDLIFKIGNGSLRLKNMTNHAITVKDSSGEMTTKIYGNGYSPQQVIKNLVKAWGQTLLANKSTEKLDESIQLCSQFKTIQEVIDKMVADCRAAGDAETFLRDYCGIILNNEDTGAITGWNAGGLSIKTADNIVGETLSSLKHVPDYTNTTFKTSQGVAVNLSSTGDSLTADGKKFFDAVYSWWAEESLKLIEESYGVNFKAGDEINIALTPSASYSGHTSGGKDISINLQSVWFNDENNYTDNSIDRTLAHEFTHVAQSLFMGRFPKFLQEGFADLTCGVDDRGGKYGNIEILASNADSLSSYLNLNNYDTGNSYYYVAGYMFLRYLAKQASDSYDSSKSYAWKDGSSIVGTDAAELLTGNAKNQTLSAGAGNDTVTAYGEKMKIFGDDGDDYILTGTNAKNLTISAGAGNDSIQNYGEKVKINAGAGKDTIYSKSNFATIDGGKGNDSIENRGGSKVTIVGGAGNDTIRNNNRDEYNYDEQKWETVSKPDNVTISSGKGNDHIFNEGSKVKITSGAGNDYISNDGANVTINGGTGNDTLSGKAKTFIYADGDGNDVITSYSSKTTINLTNGSIGSSSLDGSDVILNIGNGSIRLKYSSDKKITIKDAKGKVTSKTYTNKNLLIKGTKGNDTLKAGKGSNITINADKGNDYIVNCADKTSLNGENGNDILINGGYWEEERGGKNATLYGGKGNDTLISHGLKSSLDGGKGNDSIINGYRYYEPWKAFYDPDNENYNGSNSTISGGTGNDSIKNCGKNVVFTYKAGDGNDLIQGFNATSTLNISGSVYSTKTSGSNVIVKVGKGMVTLSGAATLPALNIKCDKVLNLTDKSKSKVTATSAVEFVNASVRTKAISIKGNALNNSITGGNGNDSIAGRAGKDTLRGGKGNDKLWGGDGADTFIYDSGDGQDIIYGFDNSDMLQITGAFSASYKKSKKEIYFKVGSTSKAITLKNFTATSFNVNGTSYQINGSKLK